MYSALNITCELTLIEHAFLSIATKKKKKKYEKKMVTCIGLCC